MRLPPDYDSTYRPYDCSGKMMHIGDQVIIRCEDDKHFYLETGIIKLINEQATTVFVEMITSGGGVWWHSENLQLDRNVPNYPRVPKRSKLKNPKRNVTPKTRNYGRIIK